METDFTDLQELGISVRETVWKKIDAKELKEKTLQTLRFATYLVPTDGVHDFLDSDFWLVVSDRTYPPLTPLMPYGVMVYDYIQRYMPEFSPSVAPLESSWFSTVRHASFVLTTTEQTQSDAIQYAGVDAKKVFLRPMEFQALPLPVVLPPIHPRKYFLWVTNMSPHKNHGRELDALEVFYKELGGSYDVLIVGVDTHKLLDTSLDNYIYRRGLAHRIEKSLNLKKRCHVLEEVNEDTYVHTLHQAQFLWNPTLFDNGTFTVVEAACLKVPALSSDYPTMRHMDKRFSLHLLFADPYDPLDMAWKLKKMEEESEVRKIDLPDRFDLEKLTAKDLAQDFLSVNVS